MKIYVIRHGETEWNTQRRLQGWRNSPLTNKGIKMAENLRDKLKEDEIVFDYIYTSDQERAIKTAKIIRDDKDTDIIQTLDLREIGFGPWEGMRIDEIYRKYGKEYDTYINKSHLFKPIENGESFEDIFRRVNRVLKKIIEKGGDNILIVSHGVTIKILTAIVKDIPLEKLYEIPIHRGTSLNILEVDNDEIKFILEGDTSHMEDIR